VGYPSGCQISFVGWRFGRLPLDYKVVFRFGLSFSCEE
jgi:hypothetical protein